MRSPITTDKITAAKTELRLFERDLRASITELNLTDFSDLLEKFIEKTIPKLEKNSDNQAIQDFFEKFKRHKEIYPPGSIVQISKNLLKEVFEYLASKVPNNDRGLNQTINEIRVRLKNATPLLSDLDDIAGLLNSVYTQLGDFRQKEIDAINRRKAFAKHAQMALGDTAGKPNNYLESTLFAVSSVFAGGSLMPLDLSGLEAQSPTSHLKQGKVINDYFTLLDDMKRSNNFMPKVLIIQERIIVTQLRELFNFVAMNLSGIATFQAKVAGLDASFEACLKGSDAEKSDNLLTLGARYISELNSPSLLELLCLAIEYRVREIENSYQSLPASDLLTELKNHIDNIYSSSLFGKQLKNIKSLPALADDLKMLIALEEPVAQQKIEIDAKAKSDFESRVEKTKKAANQAVNAIAGLETRYRNLAKNALDFSHAIKADIFQLRDLLGSCPFIIATNKDNNRTFKLSRSANVTNFSISVDDTLLAQKPLDLQKANKLIEKLKFIQVVLGAAEARLKNKIDSNKGKFYKLVKTIDSNLDFNLSDRELFDHALDALEKRAFKLITLQQSAVSLDETNHPVLDNLAVRERTNTSKAFLEKKLNQTYPYEAPSCYSLTLKFRKGCAEADEREVSAWMEECFTKHYCSLTKKIADLIFIRPDFNAQLSNLQGKLIDLTITAHDSLVQLSTKCKALKELCKEFDIQVISSRGRAKIIARNLGGLLNLVRLRLKVAHANSHADLTCKFDELHNQIINMFESYFINIPEPLYKRTATSFDFIPSGLPLALARSEAVAEEYNSLRKQFATLDEALTKAVAVSDENLLERVSSLIPPAVALLSDTRLSDRHRNQLLAQVNLFLIDNCKIYANHLPANFTLSAPMLLEAHRMPDTRELESLITDGQSAMATLDRLDKERQAKDANKAAEKAAQEAKRIAAQAKTTAAREKRNKLLVLQKRYNAKKIKLSGFKRTASGLESEDLSEQLNKYRAGLEFCRQFGGWTLPSLLDDEVDIFEAKFNALDNLEPTIEALISTLKTEKSHAEQQAKADAEEAKAKAREAAENERLAAEIVKAKALEAANEHKETVNSLCEEYKSAKAKLATYKASPFSAQDDRIESDVNKYEGKLNFCAALGEKNSEVDVYTVDEFSRAFDELEKIGTGIERLITQAQQTKLEAEKTESLLAQASAADDDLHATVIPGSDLESDAEEQIPVDSDLDNVDPQLEIEDVVVSRIEGDSVSFVEDDAVSVAEDDVTARHSRPDLDKDQSDNRPSEADLISLGAESIHSRDLASTPTDSGQGSSVASDTDSTGTPEPKLSLFQSFFGRFDTTSSISTTEKDKSAIPKTLQDALLGEDPEAVGSFSTVVDPQDFMTLADATPITKNSQRVIEEAPKRLDPQVKPEDDVLVRVEDDVARRAEDELARRAEDDAAPRHSRLDLESKKSKKKKRTKKQAPPQVEEASAVEFTTEEHQKIVQKAHERAGKLNPDFAKNELEKIVHHIKKHHEEVVVPYFTEIKNAIDSHAKTNNANLDIFNTLKAVLPFNNGNKIEVGTSLGDAFIDATDSVLFAKASSPDYVKNCFTHIVTYQAVLDRNLEILQTHMVASKQQVSKNSGPIGRFLTRVKYGVLNWWNKLSGNKSYKLGSDFLAELSTMTTKKDCSYKINATEGTTQRVSNQDGSLSHTETTRSNGSERVVTIETSGVDVKLRPEPTCFQKTVNAAVWAANKPRHTKLPEQARKKALHTSDEPIIASPFAAP